jgi:hypothetical protein
MKQSVSNQDKLRKCKCGAKFDPTIQWATGFRPWGRNSTIDPNFTATGLIPLGNCPVCRRTPEEQVR